MRPLASTDLSRLAQLACLVEAAVEKPGNVTPTRAFEDCTFAHFAASAVAVGPAMGGAGEATVGEIVLRSVRDTRSLVGTNTNLGIVLLLAPLVRAAASAGQDETLRGALARVLGGLDRADARSAYQAIRLAAPAGIGVAVEHDVREEEPHVTLLQAMQSARDRDAVAREYCTDYAVTFGCGVPALRAAWDAGHGLRGAVLRAYLRILAEVPDTLIARKAGEREASRVSRRAADVLAAEADGGEAFGREVAKLDAELRDDRHRLNPGTTADLVCAALFALFVAGDAPGGLAALLGRW